MKSTEQKERFIELRASGLSFDKIVKELGVSKPTLIKWQNELSEQISEATFYRYQTILEQFEYSREQRIQTLAKFRHKIKAELEKRDLSNVPTKRLFELLEGVEAKLKTETEGLRLKVGEADLTSELLNDIIDKHPVTIPLD